jgi:hypothetical protein
MSNLAVEGWPDDSAIACRSAAASLEGPQRGRGGGMERRGRGTTASLVGGARLLSDWLDYLFDWLKLGRDLFPSKTDDYFLPKLMTFLFDRWQIQGSIVKAK